MSWFLLLLMWHSLVRSNASQEELEDLQSFNGMEWRFEVTARKGLTECLIWPSLMSFMSLTEDKSDKGSKNQWNSFRIRVFHFLFDRNIGQKKEGIGLLNTTLKAASTNKLAQISRVLCENGFKFLYTVKGKRGITASLSLLIDK